MKKLVGRSLFEFSQSADNGLFKVVCSLKRVVVRAAERFRNYPVDYPELEKRGSVQLKRFCRLGGVFAVLPQNGGAALGTDHRIIRVLKH